MSHELTRGPRDARSDAGKPNATEESSQTQANPADDRPQCERTGAPKEGVASVQQCMAGLSSLPGLIALGYITTAQANAIRGTYATILAQHQRAQAHPDGARAGIDLTKVVRENPELASLLEPLFTDEQLQSFMRDARDVGDDGDG
jgi:hypothetical protein